jgi:hypothetical protein
MLAFPRYHHPGRMKLPLDSRRTLLRIASTGSSPRAEARCGLRAVDGVATVILDLNESARFRRGRPVNEVDVLYWLRGMGAQTGWILGASLSVPLNPSD